MLLANQISQVVEGNRKAYMQQRINQRIGSPAPNSSYNKAKSYILGAYN